MGALLSVLTGMLEIGHMWFVESSLSLAIGCLLALGIYLRDGGPWNNFVD